MVHVCYANFEEQAELGVFISLENYHDYTNLLARDTVAKS